jgi:hypothetical protein
MNLRKITSLTMLISFILLVLTSVILYIVPHGRVAYWADWHMWGLTKTQWANLHINLGFLFLLAGILHIFYNWKPIIVYMKNRSRELKIFTPSFTLSLILPLVVGVGTLLNVPPMSTVINFGESIKDAAAEKYGEPPYGHAELSSLKLFARQTNTDLEQAKMLLKEAGIQFDNDQQTILTISQLNNVAPKKIGEIIKPAAKQVAEGTPFPDAPPTGFGRQTLAAICSQYNLTIPVIIRALAQQGIKAAPEQTIKEIAAANNMDPHAFFGNLHNAVLQ